GRAQFPAQCLWQTWNRRAGFSDDPLVQGGQTQPRIQEPSGFGIVIAYFVVPPVFIMEMLKEGVPEGSGFRHDLQSARDVIGAEAFGDRLLQCFEEAITRLFPLKVGCVGSEDQTEVHEAA